MNNNEGNDFVVMFPQNKATQTDMVQQLYLTYLKSTKITASVSSPGQLNTQNSAPVINAQVELQGGEYYLYYC